MNDPSPPTSERLPPHSDEAELGLLGCIMHSQLECLEQCAALDVQPTTFYDLNHRLIYQAMVRLCMAAKKIDTITLCEHLRSRKELGTVGGMGFVDSLKDKTPSAAMASDYIAILLDLSLRRSAIVICTEAVAQSYDKPPENWLADFRDRVIQLRIGSSINARTIGSLILPPKDDPTELIKHRFLCQRGILLINGPTGLGKSSLIMQCLALWSNGLPVFGMVPVRPLTAVLIQAENDDGDLAEMRDGICTGLNLTAEQRGQFFSKVHVMTSNGTTGRRFFSEVVQPLLITHKPDLLLIDPANSFIGGDVKEQKDVGAFLRTWLLPLLHAHNCAAVIVHHTNKPPTGKDKGNWRNGEFAYAGSGSAEWANASRAVLTIQDTGTHGIYRLHAPKRGVRLHWRSPDDPEQPIYERLIGHATDGHIYWRDATEQEVIPHDGGRPKSYTNEDLLDLLGDSGLTSGQWEKSANEFCGVKSRTFQRALGEFRHANLILKSKIDQKWKRIITA